LLSALRQYVLLSQGKSFNIRIVDNFYGSLMSLPKLFFDTRKTGDLVARLNDTMRIQRVISDIAGVYIIDCLILIVTMVFIFIYQYLRDYFACNPAIIFFLIVYRRNKKDINSQHEEMAGYAMSEGKLHKLPEGYCRDKEHELQKLYTARNKSIFTNFQERAFSLGKIKVSLGDNVSCRDPLSYGFARLRVITGDGFRYDPGRTDGYLVTKFTLLPSVMNLALIAIPLSEARVAIERMFEFHQVQTESTGVEKREII
jgi:ATP-binding cassette subfamily B protein